MHVASLARALQLQKAGQLPEAEQTCRKLLESTPNASLVWALLGEICHTRGNLSQSADSYQKSLQLEPRQAVVHNNLGVVLMNLGSIGEAVACFRQALLLKGDYPEAHNNLGLALASQGELEAAVASYRQALFLWPSYPEAHNNLGLALARQGKNPEAEAAFRQAVRLKPDYVRAVLNLADLLQAMGRAEEAIGLNQQALRLDTQSPEAHAALGVVLFDLRRPEEAAARLRHAILLKPDYAHAYNNLGNALMALARQQQAEGGLPTQATPAGGRTSKELADEALACYRQAVRLDPADTQAHYNLAICLMDHRDVDQAVASYRDALRIQPTHAAALNNLGNIYKDQGLLDEAITCYSRAISADPRSHDVHSNLLYALQYHPRASPEAVWAEHQRYARKHAAPLAASIRPPTVDPNPERRLRVGYVSPDFRRHVMGQYSDAVLAGHDHQHFEVFCYSDAPFPDVMTQRIQGYADHWRSLVGVPDERAAELIRQDRIDILMDLAGHTAGNRMLVFARKPAPLQASLFGYPYSTGLATLDYRIADPYQDPPGMMEQFHTEQIIRFPEMFWCYPPPEGPDVGPLPAQTAGHVTFASFNNQVKITLDILALWARILQAVPGSRIWIFTMPGSLGRSRILNALAHHGISLDRVQLLGRTDRYLYFQQFQSVDICLDTYPFTGCNTTADSLWMGVPMVTLAGRTPASRQGISLLTLVGLGELIVHSPDAYVETAVRLAGDLEGLARMRSLLRAKMQNSLITDCLRCTRQLEAIYDLMWRTWCAQQGAAGSAKA